MTAEGAKRLTLHDLGDSLGVARAGDQGVMDGKCRQSIAPQASRPRAAMLRLLLAAFGIMAQDAKAASMDRGCA